VYKEALSAAAKVGLATVFKGRTNMSEDLQTRFQQATQDVTRLSKAPDNDVKLQLYTLFKQGTVGDCTGERPGMLDFMGRIKYDAWKKLEGTSQEDAMQKYVDLVTHLQAADGK